MPRKKEAVKRYQFSLTKEDVENMEILLAHWEANVELPGKYVSFGHVLRTLMHNEVKKLRAKA